VSPTAVRLWSTLVATLVVIGGPAALSAQAPTLKPLPRKATTSCGPLALILVTVVDSKGAPVTDAKVDVKRERDGKEVPGAMADMSPSGEYVVMDDTSLPLVPAGGANFVVRARRGKQEASAVLRIARTSNGCHVSRVENTTKVILGK
jgi:hypothetical protein